MLRRKFFYLSVAICLLLGMMGPAQVLAAHPVEAPAAPAATTVALDGTPDYQGFTSQTVSLDHTTGTGSNRLLLVGISFNCSSSSPLVTLNTVTFTPSGGSALTMTQAAWKDAASSRVAAIYYLPPSNNPTAGTPGTVDVTFNGGTTTACTTGIVVGAANFSGVDQSNPLGTAASNSSTSTQTISVNVATTGNELVFDTVQTGYSSDPGLTMDPGQTNLWNLFVTGKNTSGGASTKAAASGTTTMTWTRTAAAGYMSLVAVPINPVTGPTISISGTLSVFSTIHGTPSTTQTYNVSGSNLTSDISILAPTGFDIATASGGPYSSDLTLTQSGGTVGSTPIYARLTGADEGTFSGNITHTSADATEKYVAVSGTVSHPPIEKSVDKATAGPGETLSYTINKIHHDGSDLLTNVTVADTIPAGTTYVADSDTPEATEGSGLLTWNLGSNVAGTPGSAGGGGSVTLDGTAGSTPVQDSTPSTGVITNATSVTFSHTTGSGANRVLLVAVSFYNSTTARTVSSVTFNGTSNYLYLVGTIYNGNTRRVEIWEMTAPPASTTGNVVVTLSGTTSYAVAGAVSFRDVDQCNPVGTFLGATGTGTTASVSPTTVDGDLVFDTVAGGSALTIDSSQASQWNTSTTNIFGAASTKTATTSPTSMSWTLSSGAWAIGAVTIKPVNSSVSCAATVTSASSITDAHTTGTGANRLMLVGVSWNAGSSTAKVPTTGVTFTYGGTTLTLTKQVEREQGSGGSYRYASIYSYVNPPSGQAGTVTVNFSANVTNGIVVGVANFAGVDQTTPIGATAGNSGAAVATFNVSIPTTDSNELVFDTAFRGGTAPAPYMFADPSQTMLWNATEPYNTNSNARGAASTKQATSTSTTMAWTQYGTTGTWVIAAAAINPATNPVRTTTLSAYSTLVSTGNTLTLQARFENTSANSNVTPGTLTMTPTGGASCSTLTGPTLVSADDDIAGSSDPVIYQWVCTAAGGTTLPSSLAFSVDATGDGPITYPSGTSNSVLVVPDLAFQVTVNTVPGVDQIDNTASLKDNGAIIGTKKSYPATTTVEVPPTCYALTLSHTGSGADPIAAPGNSTGCDAGKYIAGEDISLSGAVPGTGWTITGWTGTNDDASTAGTNSLLMPAAGHSVEVHYEDVTPPDLTINSVTDSVAGNLVGTLLDGYTLPTTNVATLDHTLQWSATVEPLANEYFGLKLIDSTVGAQALKAYYDARGVPDPYLAYLKAAADGTNPFVYIKGSTVTLVDAAKHDIQDTDVDMTVPDDFPLGTYTVEGKIKDTAGNETTVTLKLIVTGDRVAPDLTVNSVTDSVAGNLVGTLLDGYTLPTTNVATLDHTLQWDADVEPLQATCFGLKLIDSTVGAQALKAYYDARGVPDPYLTYLKAAADGTNPFVYIKGSTVTLVDAAKHDIQDTDVDMTVPDDFPLGTYTVQGVIRDLAGNETTVTLKLIVSGDRVRPVLTITGATADGAAMGGDLATGYILETLGNPADDWLIQFASGTVASEPLEDAYFGLKLISSTVTPAALEAYYTARGVPEPYLTYLKGAANAVNPFVYIKGSTVTLVDAAKHDIQFTDVDMTVPDNFPPGTYTVAGQIRDVAGNPTTVTLILVVTVDTAGPVLTVTGATADGNAMGGTLEAGYVLPTTNDPELDHLIQFAAGTAVDEELAGEYFGLYLVDSTVTADFLKAYYDWKGVPEPYLPYLQGAADGANPFVYIKGDSATTAVSLVDAAKHDLGAGDEAMTVPDTFPSGTYTVQGVIKDLAGNETTVTLILVVQGPAPAAPTAPVVSIAREGSNVRLSWPAVQTDAHGNFIGSVTNYYVYFNEAPYFVPGATPYTYGVLVPALSWPDSTVPTGPGMRFYIVRAENNNKVQSADSNHLGVFVFGLVPGSTH